MTQFGNQVRSRVKSFTGRSQMYCEDNSTGQEKECDILEHLTLRTMEIQRSTPRGTLSRGWGSIGCRPLKPKTVYLVVSPRNRYQQSRVIGLPQRANTDLRDSGRAWVVQRRRIRYLLPRDSSDKCWGGSRLEEDIA